LIQSGRGPCIGVTDSNSRKLFGVSYLHRDSSTIRPEILQLAINYPDTSSHRAFTGNFTDSCIISLPCALRLTTPIQNWENPDKTQTGQGVPNATECATRVSTSSPKCWLSWGCFLGQRACPRCSAVDLRVTDGQMRQPRPYSAGRNLAGSARASCREMNSPSSAGMSSRVSSRMSNQPVSLGAMCSAPAS